MPGGWWRMPILANRFRCLLTQIMTNPETVKKIVIACCVLHNLLSVRNPRQLAAQADHENPETHEITKAAWREERRRLEALEALQGNTATKAGKEHRDYLTSYYNTIGAVPWQDRMI